ncbi:hypothetical protein LWI28_011863 [Acer negundo]|uniref:Agamous-like MADS-box protein AGL12 n=1 Tax=Acer negundo TaxID=4023 RepID=A0AAD5P5N8_ACENE|nr:hypothetical protein LWI28_011863 [Acer negundo]KAK4859446.1 hypothetical protein QYF36_005671 [Acer negundo]
MARGKVQMKRVENPVHRQVTFCKRRAGLLKKAKELSVLCDADIGLLIFSAHGKLYELATKGTMQGLIERYFKSSRGAQTDQPIPKEMQATDAKDEINMLKQEIETLQKGLRYMFGGGAETMTLDELLVLEKHLELWIYNIRSAKMDIMFQEINVLRNKEGILTAANKYLQDKIEENTVIANFEPVTTNIDFPLIIPDQIFQI